MIGTPQSLRFEQHDAVVHEYQIDGTDSTNNFSLDTDYLHSIAPSPYYGFQAWMRNLDGTSHWSDVYVSLDGRPVASMGWPAHGTALLLPATSNRSALRIQFQLRRPETPMAFELIMPGNTLFQVRLNRNDRQITVTQGSTTIARAFFPVDVLPFAAMALDTLLRTMICAIFILLLVFLCEMGLVAAARLRAGRVQPGSAQGTTPTSPSVGVVPCADPRPPAEAKPDDDIKEAEDVRTPISEPVKHAAMIKEEGPQTVPVIATKNPIIRSWYSLTAALHPLALVMLVGSFCFVTWIAYVQYQGEPHIYDASAYLFAAKMYATGHFSVPLPAVVDRFPGPFMVQFAGQWFGQYAPGTALTLVPGIWLGVPWLVEPLLGTFTLLAIGLLAARLFDRRVATLAVVLGTLSPFYSYLAASYLSHAVALFYLAWGLWALLRFAQGEAGWNLPLAAFLFGMGGLTRDLVAILFVITVMTGIIWLSWQQLRTGWQRWIVPGLQFLVIACAFVIISLSFNALLTHNPWTTPRSLFFQGDRWGFGQGIGFYGQHTLAAGLVNIDELLTILQIDLYGWPFYFTLAFLALPFLTRRARKADWFCLISATILTGACMGYFYHGIYLGPRYLFECLPFLLMLTARGILTLAATSKEAAQALNIFWQKSSASLQKTLPLSIPTLALVSVLVLYNLLYFLPRQIQLYQGYSGLPTGYHINLAQVYHPPFHNAIVVTGDYTIYQMALFALNDPYLRGDVIYAWGSTMSDYSELQKAFPGRKLYQMNINPDGSVEYTLIRTRVSVTQAVTSCNVEG
jgi:hypothetical protein